MVSKVFRHFWFDGFSRNSILKVVVVWFFCVPKWEWNPQNMMSLACQHSNIPIQNITTQSVASPRTPHLSMIPIMTFTFDLWPPKSIGFTMVNMSAKFNEEAQNGLVCIWFTAYFHTPLWPWPLTSKIKRVHPLTMINISAKFDEEIHNGLVSFVFTRAYLAICPLWPWPLTSDLQNR